MEAQQGTYDDGDLGRIMGRLAAGDEAAVVTLYERYGGPIAAAVRRVARHRPGRLADDEVPGVALEVCFDLAPVACGWSSEGGALPWVWARHRVANAVDRALGQQAHPLDEERLAALDRLAAPPPGPATDEPSLLATLGRMVPEMASAALLAEALDRGGVSTRDRELFLEYAYEKHSATRPRPRRWPPCSACARSRSARRPAAPASACSGWPPPRSGSRRSPTSPCWHDVAPRPVRRPPAVAPGPR